MTNEEFNYIKSIIDKDIKKKDYRHLEGLKNYLLEFASNDNIVFNDPELEEKRDILLTPLKELLKDKVAIGFGVEIAAFSATMELLDRKDVPVDTRKLEVLGAHIIQLDEARVKNFRSVGDKKFALIKEAIEEKGLSFGNVLSREENKKILKAYSKAKTR